MSLIHREKKSLLIAVVVRVDVEGWPVLGFVRNGV
jgi:hypothetical protein